MVFDLLPPDPLMKVWSFSMSKRFVFASVILGFFLLTGCGKNQSEDATPPELTPEQERMMKEREKEVEAVEREQFKKQR